MTSLAQPIPAAAPSRGVDARRMDRVAMWAGCLIAALFMLPQAWSVWSRGTFLDPDDAMRAVQLREFLAGQGWFDLVPHRLSPDHPFAMHWSRLVDAPLAVVERLFGLVLPAQAAERAMRIVVPVGLFVLALRALLDLVRRLAGGRAALAGAVTVATCSELVTNYLPGHIHHHGLQVTLLLGATASLVEAIGPRPRASRSALAGLLVALSLGIGLQNLPFVVGLCTVAVLAWVWHGQQQARSLAGFGLGLCTALPIFLFDVPPGQWGAGACDAYSAAHLLALGGTALACFGLAVLFPRLHRTELRAFCAVAAGALVLGAVARFYPACLHDPMAGVDPVLRKAWLSGVGEALPLSRLIAVSWPNGVALLATLLTGIAATLAATASATPDVRPRWLALLLLAGIGFVGCLWEVRVASSTLALLVPGVAWAAVALFETVARRPKAPALLAAFVVVAAGSGAGWSALARPLGLFAAPGTDGPSPDSCFDPASLTGLQALPPGLVLSTIDPGSAILAFTSHSVLAAPYHRDSYGNRISLLALAAPPDDARPLIDDSRATYLALCRASNETAETVAEHPDSLSAALMAGRTPDWLKPIGAPADPYLLFEVRKAP